MSLLERTLVPEHRYNCLTTVLHRVHSALLFHPPSVFNVSLETSYGHKTELGLPQTVATKSEAHLRSTKCPFPKEQSANHLKQLVPEVRKKYGIHANVPRNMTFHSETSLKVELLTSESYVTHIIYILDDFWCKNAARHLLLTS